MKLFVVWCLTAVTLVSGFGNAFAADDAAKGKNKKNAQAGGQGAQVFRLPEEVKLTADQQEKLMALKKEFGPKIAELQKKADAILTTEQLTARKEAMAKVKADNLKGKERQEAINAAVNLTAEQKEKSKSVQSELQALNATVRGKIAELLTDEQKAKVPNLTPKTKKKKNA